MRLNHHIFPDKQILSQTLGDEVITSIIQGVEKNGYFTLALAGGSTPKVLYELMCEVSNLERIPWTHVKVFFGDERYVAADHPDSNYAMAREALLAEAEVHGAEIYRVETELNDPQETARRYHQTILEHVPSQGFAFPRFDLMLLGLGDDGHTASLFPNTNALKERDQVVVANYVDKLDTWRITATYPLIESAHKVAFIVTGQNKAKVVYDLFADPQKTTDYPVEPLKHLPQTHWYFDQAAVEDLKGDV